jgi:uncharacterized protein with LGFP repeats
VDGGTQQLFVDGGLYRNGSLALTVWIRGALDAEYRSMGTGAGVLGVPSAGVLDLSGKARGSCFTCKVARFVGGRIYLKGSTGAHALWGPLLQTYLNEGGAGGWLGFPLTRVRDREDGGVKARFEHGRIDCPAGSGCRATAT